MRRWIKQLFKQKPETFNIYHPDFADKIEPATDNKGKQLEVDGIKYYRFKIETVMPYSRYKYLQAFIKQVDLRMTYDLLKSYIDKIEKHISGERGTVNLTKVFEIIMAMKSRLALTFEIETTYEYASVIYFDDKENLYNYDKKHNEEKIARWREANTVDFFYMRPMEELFGLKDISKIDLGDFISQQREILSGLTSEIQEQ